MQIQHVGDRIRGFDRVGALWHLWEMTPKDAHERLRILRFCDTHGLLAMLEAFEVSRRTLTRWKAELRGGNAAALVAKSSARRRRPRTDPCLGTEIQRLRTLDPNRGKERSSMSCGTSGARSTAFRGPQSSRSGGSSPVRPTRGASSRLVWTLGAAPYPSSDARSPVNPPELTPRPPSAGRWIPSSVFVTVFGATS